MQQINLNNKKTGSKIPSIDEIKEIVFVKYKRVTIMCMIIMFLIAVMVTVFGKYSDSEKSAGEKYAKYVNSLYANDNTASNKLPDKVILPAEGTVDIDKINSDIATAESILGELFTFENGEQYDKNRETLITMFGEDSDIIKSVFTVNDKTTVDGKEYNYVDINGINMKVTNIRTYPIDISNDGNNRYLSCVSFSSTTKDGANVSYMLSVLYDIDEYGSMIDCDVYLLRNKY